MGKKPKAPKSPVRVAIYPRVSSEEQAKEHYSLDTQEAKCLAKLDAVYGKNLYIYEIFRDEGYKGSWGLYDPHNPKKKHRPGLTRMRDAFKEGKFDIMCVYRSSRLWRKASMGDFLMDEFVPYGLQHVISCTENVDLSTASGRLQVNVSSAFNAFEAEQLGEWVSDALQKRKADGYPIGMAYGWQRKPKGENGNKRPGIKPDPDASKLVKMIARKYQTGDTLRGIAKWLNTTAVPTPGEGKRWHMSSVKHMLANPVHPGLVAVEDEDGNTQYIRGQHYQDRFYDPQVFYQIKQRLDRNQTPSGRGQNHPEHLLRGKLKCGHCDNYMNARYVQRRNCRVYRCSTDGGVNNAQCARNAQRGELVEAVVIEELKQLAAQDNVRHSAAVTVKQILAQQEEQLDADIERLENRLSKLWDNYKFWSAELTGGRCERDEFDIHLEEFRTGKAEVEQQLAQERQQRVQADVRAAVLERATQLIEDFTSSWAGLSMHQRRETLHAVLQSATQWHLDDGRTKIDFQIRGFEPVTRYIEQLHDLGRPDNGPDSLTPKQQLYLYWYAQGSDRKAIAKKYGVTYALINTMLWQARKKLNADTLEEAWELAKDKIEPNLPWLLKLQRKRKPRNRPLDRPTLTKTQVKLLTCLANGKPIKQAAGKTSINTAYVHLMNIRDRLGVATNQEAIQKAIDLGYVKLKD